MAVLASFLRPSRAVRITPPMCHGLRGVRLTADMLHPWLHSPIPPRRDRKATNNTVNGLLNKKGDLDHFRFQANRGERIVIECWAERIDSPLRAVLEIYDSHGRRVAVNRGYFGIDPLIDFFVPADGEYINPGVGTKSPVLDCYCRIDGVR